MSGAVTGKNDRLATFHSATACYNFTNNYLARYVIWHYIVSG